MDDIISKLSEIRFDYNCFDEDEEPYYRALSEAIKILSQLVRCQDCAVTKICRYRLGLGDNGFCSQGRRSDD